MKKLLITILILQTVLIIGLFFGADLVSAQGGADVVELKNPLKFAGFEIGSPGELVVRGFTGFASLIGLIAIGFTVFMGFKLSIATTEEALETAKKGLQWSVGGFVVAIFAFSIVTATANILGFNPNRVNPDQDNLQPPLDIAPDFITVMFYIMQNFLGLIGFAVTLVIIYNGFQYLTSGGNQDKIESAKQGLKWSILGLAVTLLSFTIISGIRTLLV